MIKLRDLLWEIFTSKAFQQREKNIQNWLNAKQKNAPGETHQDKLEWLFKNDPQYKKMVDFFIYKFPKVDTEKYKYKEKWIKEAKRYYVRFGDIPTSGRSMNHLNGRLEKGISAYEVKWDIAKNKWKIVEDDLSEIGLSTLYSFQDDVCRGKGRPIYLIEGETTGEVGMDDTEPLLDIDKIKIIKKLKPDEVYSTEIGEDWYLPY
jgi:hypothetical protein